MRSNARSIATERELVYRRDTRAVQCPHAGDLLKDVVSVKRMGQDPGRNQGQR